MASPLRPQSDMLLLIEGSNSCGGNFAFSPNDLPALASSLDCCSLEDTEFFFSV